MNTAIQDFIVGQIAEHRGLDGREISTDADLFERGHIDSLGVFNMMTAIEDEFGIRFNENDLVDPAINTVRGLASIVARKRGRAA